MYKLILMFVLLINDGIIIIKVYEMLYMYAGRKAENKCNINGLYYEENYNQVLIYRCEKVCEK